MALQTTLLSFLIWQFYVLTRSSRLQPRDQLASMTSEETPPLHSTPSMGMLDGDSIEELAQQVFEADQDSGLQTVTAMSEEAAETFAVINEHLGRCYNPIEEEEWHVKFHEAVSEARNLSNMPHVAVVHRPVQKLVDIFSRFGMSFLPNNVLPFHTAAVLTSDRNTEVRGDQSWADSHCFLFDYTDPNIEDPHGCRFFKKSFEPMQTLRDCILVRLASSPEWQKYQKVSKKIVQAREAGIRSDRSNPLDVDDEDKEILDLEEHLKEHLDVVKMTFDGIRRADEMVKYVSHKDWTDPAVDIVAKVEEKLSETIITQDKQTLLEPGVITKIRKECFKIEDDHHTWNDLTAEAKEMKLSMPCYPLMWDSTEVSGGREKPTSNAITMWDPSLKTASTVKQELSIPPVCARAAVALVVEATKRAPKGFSYTACIRNQKSWKKCLHPNHFNCQCYTDCWLRSLQKICEFEPMCCSSGFGTKL